MACAGRGARHAHHARKSHSSLPASQHPHSHTHVSFSFAFFLSFSFLLGLGRVSHPRKMASDVSPHPPPSLPVHHTVTHAGKRRRSPSRTGRTASWKCECTTQNKRTHATHEKAQTSCHFESNLIPCLQLLLRCSSPSFPSSPTSPTSVTMTTLLALL